MSKLVRYEPKLNRMIGVAMVADDSGWYVLASEAESREDALREELKRYKALFSQSEKVLDRVHCMYGKRLLDLTGEPQTVLVPDEEFVKYFEELKTLKRENSALQQRLTVAEQFVQKLVDCSKGKDRIATGYLSDILDVLKSAAGCEHSFHYFGDYPRRRCNNCNALEVIAEGEGS